MSIEFIPKYSAPGGRFDREIANLHNLFDGSLNRYELWLEAYRGDLDAVKRCVEQKGTSQKPNGENRAPIDVAAMNGHLHVVKYLAENGEKYLDSCSTGAIRLAARNGHLQIVRYLLLVEDGWLGVGTTVMSQFIHVENLDMVKHLVEVEHVVVDERDSLNRTALTIAATLYNVDIASYLLSKHADINPISDDDGAPRADESPLRNAAHYGLDRMVNFLLDNGANLEASDGYGRTALMMATIDNHFSTANLLILRGANINPTDFWGQTPIHFAAAMGKRRMVELFIRRGADISILCKNGRFPWQAAKDNCHYELSADMNNPAFLERFIHDE